MQSKFDEEYRKEYLRIDYDLHRELKAKECQEKANRDTRGIRWFTFAVLIVGWSCVFLSPWIF